MARHWNLKEASMSDTIDQNVITRYRVMIFVDFWNFTLSMKSVEDHFRPDWKKLPNVIMKEAVEIIDATAIGVYTGMRVYGSFDGSGDAPLRKWVSTTLDTFPGVNVKFVDRQKKRTGPKCPSCYEIVEICPKCGKDMRGTEEKGVDTAIATDMISLAWEGAFDAAVLVSADRDFIPVAEYLHTKGVKVIHAAFPPKGAQLSQKCWGSIDLPALRNSFRRPAPVNPAS
ncbi:MAG: NYN domain-containing protein [Alphaproteobacteria bacterium]|nr:NYN domain-containing protein [Alphaproteobacteria bacterium]